MKRFHITNKATGLKFMVEREALGELQPEWGRPERDELDEEGKPTGRKLPPEFEVVEEDITTESTLRQTLRLRQMEYPILGDFADAFVKLQLGDPTEMNAYVAKCVAVKKKYPKPGEK